MIAICKWMGGWTEQEYWSQRSELIDEIVACINEEDEARQKHLEEMKANAGKR